MKKLLPLIALLLIAPVLNAQLLNKIKQKAQNAVTKPSNKNTDNGTTQESGTAPDATAEKKNTASGETKTQDKPAEGESDFIPGSTVLYYDNFEKEKAGDLPAGWITSSSAEVTAVEGLKGKWLKLFPVSSMHLTRSKKQSWGTQFTIEFDLVMTKVDYDPRISFALINTKGNLVTDQNILRNKYYAANVGLILGDGGKKTRLSLYKNDNINSPVSDVMSEQLLYTNLVPVHVSITVQDKRFRIWWNNKKLFDTEIINPQFMPNQFGFEFGSVGGSDFYVSNIRIAKDIPATKPVGKEPTAATDTPEPTPAVTNNTVSPTNATASVKLQSKVLNIDLPYAQIMKTGENTYTFSASKEEGNYKENFFKIFLATPGSQLRTETFLFTEVNKKNSLYGTKRFPDITKTEAVLFYGGVKKPYIYQVVPRIANGHMATYVSADLDRNLPPLSNSCKLVFEKIENGLASGYFVFGMMNQGLKPITKGDAMTETFTDGFIGEVKCTFSNVPVY
jgi:hypothetical protein